MRVIDKEIQQEKVVDDVLTILGDENNVKFIKVCRTDCCSDSQKDSNSYVSRACSCWFLRVNLALRLAFDLTSVGEFDIRLI